MAREPWKEVQQARPADGAVTPPKTCFDALVKERLKQNVMCSLVTCIAITTRGHVTDDMAIYVYGAIADPRCQFAHGHH